MNSAASRTLARLSPFVLAGLPTHRHLPDPVPGEGVTVTPAPPVVTPPVPEPPAPAEIKMPKAAFDARLEQARTALMKELGIDSIDAGKAAVAAAKAAADAAKTDLERATAQATALAATQAENARLAASIATIASAQMGALTDAQRASVEAVVGNDPAAQIKMIEASRGLWAGVAPAAATPGTAPVAAKAPDTVPPLTPALNAGDVTKLTDAKAQYEALKLTNPIVAARFAAAHNHFAQ